MEEEEKDKGDEELKRKTAISIIYQKQGLK
jgi:hypothetical protein